MMSTRTEEGQLVPPLGRHPGVGVSLPSPISPKRFLLFHRRNCGAKIRVLLRVLWNRDPKPRKRVVTSQGEP